MNSKEQKSKANRLLLFVFCSVLSLMMSGCRFDISFTSPTDFASTTPPPISSVSNLSLPISFLYSSNGARFLDYFKNDGANFWSASDTACLGSETGFLTCLDGGEFLKLTLPPEVASSCAGLSATDSLAIFRWTCQTVAGYPTLLSYGFLPGKGIKDTIAPSGLQFKNLGLTLAKNGVTIAINAPVSIWTNPLALLPDNSATAPVGLSGYPAGTILTVTSNRQTMGYGVQQSQLAIVTLPNVTLTLASSAIGMCSEYGGYTPGAHTGVFCVAGQTFIWLEANVDCANVADSTNIVLTSIFTTIHGSRFSRCTAPGLIARYAQNLRVESSSFTNGASSGMYVQGNSDYGFISDSSASHNAGSGFDLPSVNSSLFLRNSSNDNGASGFYLGGAGNVLINTVAANNVDIGLSGYLSSGMIAVQSLLVSNAHEGYKGSTDYVNFLMTTVSLNGADGLRGYYGQQNSNFTNTLATNNAGSGVSGSDTGTFKNLVSTENTYGIYSSNSMTLQGAVILGNNSQACSGSGGIVNGTCTTTGLNASADWTPFTQSATLFVGGSSVGEFVGKIVSDSVAGLGALPYSSITNFTSFENRFRAWGMSGVAAVPFPDSSLRAECRGSSCQIWDWSLRAGSLQYLNRGAYFTTANSAFIDGANCPIEVDGSVTTSDSFGHTFLTNAVEIVNELALNPYGNNNGLCESNEACIYAPNVGAYQGSGDYTKKSCVFSAGTLTGIRMYAYPTNGN